ncbi:hypothetical protein HX13_20715 [Chryseobacterium sp. P1-3]|uniref:hypothetical protein n=1 Tax=Chryseobacterium sp. (strain P1-3) TaxID=1517683 RepID=UPI0004E6FC78|nr:hypothetical protein [Chryseobacterium sp. P1-3]KFF73380.1 hypothetical protein HX13_20715 [Chryseobacterium sp. P1-3]
MDSIRTINNKKIEFRYNKVLSYLEKSINERVNKLLTQRPAGNFEPSLPLPLYERFEGSTANTEWLLTQIIFPEGEVIFQYSDDERLNTITGELYRKDLNAQKGVALRRILINNKTGNTIKNLSLNYSYFESSRPNKNYQDYRLKLTEIYDNLQNSSYSFVYNEDMPIPARNSNNDDYWGYINNTSGTEETSNIPRIVNTQYVSGEVTMPNDKSRNRETNPQYSQLGVLNKITYPTKGSKKIVL